MTDVKTMVQSKLVKKSNNQRQTLKVTHHAKPTPWSVHLFSRPNLAPPNLHIDHQSIDSAVSESIKRDTEDLGAIVLFKLLSCCTSMHASFGFSHPLPIVLNPLEAIAKAHIGQFEGPTANQLNRGYFVAEHEAVS